MVVLYGQKTGVTTLKTLTRLLCRLLVRYASTIDSWVDTIPDSGQRATVRAYFVAAQAACFIIELTPDD